MSIWIAAFMGSDVVEVLPVQQRWECAKKRRYYLVCVQRNLFAELKVWRAWGGIGSTRGGQRIEPVADLDAACARVAVIEQRRRVRGYADRQIVAIETRQESNSELETLVSTPCSALAPAA